MTAKREFTVTGSGGAGYSVTASGGGGGFAAALYPAGLSYIEDHEIEQAKKLIDDQFVTMTGKPFGFRVANYFIACKLYVRAEELKKGKREDGSEYTIWLPQSATEHDKYQSVSAVVCGIGPGAFKGYDQNGHERFPHGPVCRIGDWIAIPRQNSFLLSYRGTALALIPDDMVLGVIEAPEDVAPINQASKV